MKRTTVKPAVVTVLIADDDPIVRQAVRSVLDVSGGFRVAGEAEDGKMAAELVKETDPDILLLDLLMPNLPGLEALRAITTAGSEVRTILLCSAISAKQVLEALHLGARGVIWKKRVAELVPALEAVMRGQSKRIQRGADRATAGRGEHPTSPAAEPLWPNRPRDRDHLVHHAGLHEPRHCQLALHHGGDGQAPSHQHLQQSRDVEPPRTSPVCH